MVRFNVACLISKDASSNGGDKPPNTAPVASLMVLPPSRGDIPSDDDTSTSSWLVEENKRKQKECDEMSDEEFDKKVEESMANAMNLHIKHKTGNTPFDKRRGHILEESKNKQEPSVRKIRSEERKSMPRFHYR